MDFDFDTITIIASVIALVLGLGFYYLYNRYKCDAVDDVYDTLRMIWEKYGTRIEKDNPDLYLELKSAITELDKAMDDKDITIMEAFNIAKALIPLTKRIAKYVKEQYE